MEACRESEELETEPPLTPEALDCSVNDAWAAEVGVDGLDHPYS